MRLGISLYHVHIAQWLKVIPRDQFLFLRMEDLAADGYKLLTKVWEFLSLPSQPREELEDVLNSKTNYSPVAHMKVLQLQPKTREMLEKFYSSHDHKLARMLGSDAFLWKDSREQRLLREEEEERELEEAVQAMERDGEEDSEY